MRAALWLVALAMAVLRFFIPTRDLSPSGSYEAFAHLFVGGLLGAWLATKKCKYLKVAVFLTVIELIAFFTT